MDPKICERCDESGIDGFVTVESRHGDRLTVHARFCEIPGDRRVEDD